MKVKVFVLCVLSLIVCIEDVFAERRKAVLSETAHRFTTLRAGRPSYLFGGRGGQRDVRFVSVRVTNIGDFVAKEIQVCVESTSGISLPLRGPKRLEPHASAVYAASSRISAAVGLRGEVTTSCLGCRR